MKHSKLIEQLRELIPNGDGYNDEFTHTLEAAIAELQRQDTPLPDDVVYQIQILSDPSSILSIKQQQHITGMMERLWRRTEELEGRLRDRQNALNHAIDYGKRMDERIEELTAELEGAN